MGGGCSADLALQKEEGEREDGTRQLWVIHLHAPQPLPQYSWGEPSFSQYMHIFVELLAQPRSSVLEAVRSGGVEGSLATSLHFIADSKARSAAEECTEGQKHQNQGRFFKYIIISTSHNLHNINLNKCIPILNILLLKTLYD